jgi:hypothetical protein
MYSTAMRDLKITKLSDEFGQYLIYLRCECGHIRRCHPHTLAAFAGWDARLDDVVRRLRCQRAELLCRQDAEINRQSGICRIKGI